MITLSILRVVSGLIHNFIPHIIGVLRSHGSGIVGVPDLGRLFCGGIPESLHLISYKQNH
jgi:hypothetical protein